jgi:hypothetical protein
LAPVLQRRPKGTKSPKTGLPFALGLEYSTVTSVNPTTWFKVDFGLGCGVFTWASIVKLAINTANAKIIFLMMFYLVCSKLQIVRVSNVN